MTTATQERVTAPEKINAGLQNLLDGISKDYIDAHLDNSINKCIHYLTDNPVSKESWEKVASRFNWSDLDCEFLVNVIMSTGDKLYAEELVNAILLANKINALEYFEKIVQRLNGTNLHVVDVIIRKIIANGEWYEDGNWWLLAVQFANKAASLLKQHDAETLKNVARLHNFAVMDPWFARIVGLYAIDCEHGYFLLRELIPADVFHLEDFSQHAEKFKQNEYVRGAAYYMVFMAIRKFNRQDYNWLLVEFFQLRQTKVSPKPEKKGSSIPKLESGWYSKWYEERHTL